jgi:hypothetical protein
MVEMSCCQGGSGSHGVSSPRAKLTVTAINGLDTMPVPVEHPWVGANQVAPTLENTSNPAKCPEKKVRIRIRGPADLHFPLAVGLRPSPVPACPVGPRWNPRPG